MLSVALIVMFTIPANAVSIKEADVEKEFVCTVENEKITDENILLDRALKGMNDAPKEIVKSIEENVELSVNGVVQKVTQEKKYDRRATASYGTAYVYPKKWLEREYRVVEYTI